MSCEHKVTKPTRRVIANGTTIVCLQCQNCGRGKAAKMADYVLASLPLFDPGITVRFEERERAFWAEKRAIQIYEQDNKMGEWWEKYSEYLASDHWKSVRRRVIARDIICQVCFHLSASQAHHITYQSFNKYGLSFTVECVGVCEKCHEILHQKGRA